MFIVLGHLSGIAEQQHLKISRLHAELACRTPTPRPGTGRLVLSVLAGVALSVGGPGHYFQDLFMAAFTAFLDALAALGERE